MENESLWRCGECRRPLGQVYGDYLRLPPPEERRDRHALVIRSLGEPATADPVPDGPAT